MKRVCAKYLKQANKKVILKIERKIEELDYSEGRRKWLKFFREFQDYMTICC